MKNDSNFPIDLVLTWVDGSDNEWQKEKDKYACVESCDKSDARYRNWDNLQYIFRGIENFLPWINNVFFITNGQYPKWLNLRHDKIRFVTHKDYMPSEYLPTFNSMPIELNIHRIKDLSEHFIYINDDMFFLKPQKYQDYFDKAGRPCDFAYQQTIFNIKSEKGFDIRVMDFCNLGLVNGHFRKKNVIKGHFLNWYGPYLGLHGQLLSLLNMNKNFFFGFKASHCVQSFKKSIWEEVWKAEPEYLNKTSLCKFREDTNVSQYLMRYWQFAKNDFHPKRFKNRQAFNIDDENSQAIIDAIKSNKYSMICINDSELCVIKDFDYTKKIINNAFNVILPDKSSFEL